jgi:hypothetical protein
MTRARDIADVQDNLGGAIAPYVSGKNIVINGGMDIWQRGTTFSFAGVGAGGYTADRWNSTANGTNINFTTTQDTSVPTPVFSYSLKTTQTSSAATGVTEYGLRYRIEQQSAQILTGQYATVSFWYRSSQTGSHYVRTATISGTGATDNAVTFNVPTANTWQLVKFTTSTFLNITAWTGTPNSWGAYIDLGFTGAIGGQGSTIPANAYFQTTGVQLEIGNAATPFSRAGGSIGGELALCQRYYVRYPQSGAQDMDYGIGLFTTTTLFKQTIPLAVTMRTSPTILDASGLRVFDPVSGTNYTTASSIGSTNSTPNVALITWANPTGVFTVGRSGYYNTASGYIGLSAEL